VIPDHYRAVESAGKKPSRHEKPTVASSPVIAARHLATLVETAGRFARGEPLMNVVDKAFWF
jgi:hypothetical protein